VGVVDWLSPHAFNTTAASPNSITTRATNRDILI
jgi:hypothetical protein